MFNNISDKIKALAGILCALGILISITLGIIVLVQDETALGICILIACCILSICTSYIIYGFGQLIENSNTLIKLMQKPTSNIPHTAKSPHTTNTQQYTHPTPLSKSSVSPVIKHSWRCSNCGHMISETPCPHCSNQ